MAYPPPPPPPVPYGQPSSPYGYPNGPVPARTNGMAVASMICGIASWVILPFLASIVAIILGHIARGQVKRSGEQGGGMAMAGLVLGYVNIGLGIAFTCLFGIFFLGLFGIVGAAGVSGIDTTPTPSETYSYYDTVTPTPSR